MVCSVCFECGHNKRTCPFQLKAPIGVDLSKIPLTNEKNIPTFSEMKIAQELIAILDEPTPRELKISRELITILNGLSQSELKIARELITIMEDPRKKEVFTFANGKTMHIDLGTLIY